MAIDLAIQRIHKELNGKIKTSQGIRREHGKAETHFPECLPDAVAFAESTEDVSKILKICNEEKCPIVPTWVARQQPCQRYLSSWSYRALARTRSRDSETFPADT